MVEMSSMETVMMKMREMIKQPTTLNLVLNFGGAMLIK